MSESFDLAVVGSGIVGLAHAAAATARGCRVVVIDRAASAAGATVRNFGHIGITMQAGRARDYAERSRELYLHYASRAGFWIGRTGTLLVARAEDELAVLREAGEGTPLDATAVADRAPVRGAVGGVHLPRDLQVDPREAGPALARWLAGEGVRFRRRTAALGVEPGVVHTSRGDIRAEAVVVAVNADVDELFPHLAESSGIERCGLDMMLADGVGLSVPTLTGSSLLRYAAFAHTPSIPALRESFLTEQPELIARDVNQMYTERPDGTLVVGDTHDRGPAVPPFQDEESFALLERLAAGLFGLDGLRVRQRWQGVYASGPGEFLRAEPADGVRVVSVTTGIGMTTGLGLGESVVAELFG